MIGISLLYVTYDLKALAKDSKDVFIQSFIEVAKKEVIEGGSGLKTIFNFN